MREYLTGLNNLKGDYKIHNLNVAKQHIPITENLIKEADALLLSMPYETLYEIINTKEIITHIRYNFRSIPIIIFQPYPNIGKHILRAGFPIVKENDTYTVNPKKINQDPEIETYLKNNNVMFFDILKSKVFE